jgi:uncharacterized protein
VRISDTAFKRVLLALLFASGAVLLGTSVVHALR